MKKEYVVYLNNRIYTYLENPRNEEGEIDTTFAADTYVKVTTDFKVDVSKLWSDVQEKYGSVDKHIREDITPSLDEVIDFVFDYLRSLNKKGYIRVYGAASTTCGEVNYTRESESKDSFLG